MNYFEDGNEIKNFIAHNGRKPYAVGAFNHCINLKAQNYE